MSNYSLATEPNESNIKEALQNDLLSTNSWLNKCLNVLLNMDDSIVAIDAKWGNGKTYVAKQMQEIINEKWMLQAGKQQKSYLSQVSSLYFDNLPLASSFAIYYNAWEYDNDNNPMASFLYFLLKELNKKIGSSNFEKIASSFIKNVIEKLTDGWIKISKDVQKSNLEDVLSSVLSTEFIKEEISNLIQELKSEKCNKLIIFIDELDRCRPNYALKLIEVIKHYFKRTDVLVVCLTDVEQLSYIIENVYGTNISSYLYLDKIFDFRFEIPVNKINYVRYIAHKLPYHLQDNYFFDMICLEIINDLNLSLRNIDRFLAYLKSLFLTTKKSGDMDFPLRGLLQFFFTPYYLSLKLFDIKKLNALKNYDFSYVLSFCQRKKVKDRMNQIYSMALGDKYVAGDLNEYLKHDLKRIIKFINEGENDREELIVGQRYFVSLESFIEEIDLLSSFVDGINQSSY